MADQTLQLYGTDWCTKSSALRNYMQSRWIEFEDFNVETDPTAESKIRALYGGALKFPTVVYGDDFLKNPSIRELNAFLKKYDLMD